MMKIFVVVILVLMPTSHTMAEECSRQQAFAAETNAATLTSWGSLKAHFLLYRYCDDGAIGEGYSESVSYLMAHKWNEFLALDMDEKFSNFVRRHIDESWEINRYTQIVIFAKNNCNKSKEKICKKIISIEGATE